MTDALVTWFRRWRQRRADRQSLAAVLAAPAHPRIEGDCPLCGHYLIVSAPDVESARRRWDLWQAGHRDGLVCREERLSRRMSGEGPRLTVIGYSDEDGVCRLLIPTDLVPAPGVEKVTDA